MPSRSAPTPGATPNRVLRPCAALCRLASGAARPAARSRSRCWPAAPTSVPTACRSPSPVASADRADDPRPQRRSAQTRVDAEGETAAAVEAVRLLADRSRPAARRASTALERNLDDVTGSIDQGARGRTRMPRKSRPRRRAPSDELPPVIASPAPARRHCRGAADP